MKLILTFFISLIISKVSAQDTVKRFTFFGYTEVYYGYDFSEAETGKRPSFLYNHSHHNQFNVNLVFLKFAYAKNRFRFNLAPMLGTYSQSNLSGEPFYVRQIFEASIGGRLIKKRELWLDVGVFPSHIGFESAISKDCATLSRSILAENTPYFETGVKLTYQHSSRWTFIALFLNGWQKIDWIKGNSLPSFGTQIMFQPGKKLLLNYSTFIGTDYADDVRKMRYFHNFYVIYTPVPQLAFTFGFDFGTEQQHKHSTKYNVWYSPVLIVRYQPLVHFAMAARYEFYNDKNGVMINTSTPNGFQTHGFSLNLDYILTSKVLWRVEGRLLKSKDEIFICRNKVCSINYSMLASLAIMLSK